MSVCARFISARSIASMPEPQPAKTGALSLDGVTAGYGETVVLDGVSFALAAGETLALLGRNGVGKTTLLATIMGHTRLHKGAIALDGTPIDRLPAYLRA